MLESVLPKDANAKKSLDRITSGAQNGTTQNMNDMKMVYSVDEAVNAVGYGLFQIRLTCLAGFAWLADSFEIFILSVIGEFIACDWTLYRWQIALLTSMIFAGIMVGSPILGKVADIYGRKKCLAISTVLLFIFASVSAASPSFTWMVIFRTCMGVSLGGLAQGVTLNSEYCPKDVRGRAGFYLCYFWSLGSIGVILLVWVVMEYLNNWRALLAFAAIPSLIVILSLKWYPESARYYLVSNQYDRAVHILEKMASSNGGQLPPGQLDQVGMDSKRGQMKDLLSKKYRRTSLLFWYIWLATAFGYYGIALLSPLIIQHGSLTADVTQNSSSFEGMDEGVPCAHFTQQNYIDLLWTTAAEFPGLILFTFLVEYIRRKVLLCGACVISGVLIVLLLVRTHKIVILLCMFAARAVLVSIFQLNYIMTSEAYPTTMRAVAMGTGTSFCRLGGLIVPYIAQVLVIQNPVAAMGLLGGLIFLAGVAAMFLPFETKGAELKEFQSSQK